MLRLSLYYSLIVILASLCDGTSVGLLDEPVNNLIENAKVMPVHTISDGTPISNILPEDSDTTSNKTQSKKPADRYQRLNSIEVQVRHNKNDTVRAKYPDCPLDCAEYMYNNDFCNLECYNEQCNFDNLDCVGWCAPNCKPSWLGDGFCDFSCNNEQCNFDNGDCEKQFGRSTAYVIHPIDQFDYSQCNCPKHQLNNYRCDNECNVAECNFDNGYCINFCSEDCNLAYLGDGECDSACYNEQCNFDRGDCHQCSRGCRVDMVGNGVCDDECRTSKCNYDAGDCAGFCKTYPVDYARVPFSFQGCRNEWIGDGHCDCNCFVSECNFDAGDCVGQEESCQKYLITLML